MNNQQVLHAIRRASREIKEQAVRISREPDDAVRAATYSAVLQRAIGVFMVIEGYLEDSSDEGASHED